MRSIGIKNINLVKRITKEEYTKCTHGEIEPRVYERLPESIWCTWEGADAQIRRIINDVIWGEI